MTLRMLPSEKVLSATIILSASIAVLRFATMSRERTLSRTVMLTLSLAESASGAWAYFTVLDN